MQLTFTSALNNADLEPAEDGNSFKLLLAYEDADAANRTLELLYRIAADIEGPPQRLLVCAMWKFDFLADPNLSKLAAHEVQRADVILIAGHARPALPAPLKRWIDTWVWTKTGRPMALAACLDGAPHGGADGSLVQLREAARLAGIDFIATGGGDGSEDAIKLGISQAAEQGMRAPRWECAG